MDTVGARERMLQITWRSTGLQITGVVVVNMTVRVPELLQTTNFIFGITAKGMVSATGHMENLQTTSTLIYRCLNVIFVHTSRVGISLSGIRQDFISGRKNLIL